MKKTNLFTACTALMLSLMLMLSLVGCLPRYTATDELWEDAVYTEDTTLGSGSHTVTCVIEAGEKSVTLTIKTDKATLGEALYEHHLLNDPVFFDTCNGIKADWNANEAWWKFLVNDSTVSYGVGDAQASTTGDASYKIVYTIGS